MDMKVFEFLNVEAPSSVGDIREALDLLVASINSAIEQVGEKLNVSFVNKEFKKVSELNSNSEELYNINKRIQKVIDDLDTIIDERNIEESNEKEESYGKQIPNYSDYLVDTNIEHNLYEDLTYKRPCGFKVEGEKFEIRDWKGCLVETINYLAKKNPDIIRSFVNEPKMNGKKRVYFSNSKLPTMESAREIKEAEIYIETNLSANGIRNLLIKILKRYNIKLSDYKIYFKADYSELH